ncbi:MAG: DinB family protein [Schleiferiaceae bacterium]|nr:DinB family protein [Schleiferiaceae bacterium]
MNQSERFAQYSNTISTIKKELEKNFYFQEEEALSQRPDETSWSVVEHIAHLNLVNYHYVKQLENIDFEGLPSATSATSSWFGAFFAKLMRPKADGKPLFKMRAPKALLPVSVVHPEAKILPRVAFQDLMRDLSALEAIAAQAQVKNVTKIKLQTAIGSWPKVNLVDAFEIVLAHMQRHLAVMKKIQLN